MCYLFHTEQELRDVLSDTTENNTLLRRDTVFAQLNFSLNSGMFTLISDQKHDNTGNVDLFNNSYIVIVRCL